MFNSGWHGVVRVDRFKYLGRYLDLTDDCNMNGRDHCSHSCRIMCYERLRKREYSTAGYSRRVLIWSRLGWLGHVAGMSDERPGQGPPVWSARHRCQETWTPTYRVHKGMFWKDILKRAGVLRRWTDSAGDTGLGGGG